MFLKEQIHNFGMFFSLLYIYPEFPGLQEFILQFSYSNFTFKLPQYIILFASDNDIESAIQNSGVIPHCQKSIHVTLIVKTCAKF